MKVGIQGIEGINSPAQKRKKIEDKSKKYKRLHKRS